MPTEFVNLAFVAGETPAQTAGTAAPLLPRPPSWSQCAQIMAWGLSLNLAAGGGRLDLAFDAVETSATTAGTAAPLPSMTENSPHFQLGISFRPAQQRVGGGARDAVAGDQFLERAEHFKFDVGQRVGVRVDFGAAAL